MTNFIANSFEKPDRGRTSVKEAIRNSSYCCYVIVDRKNNIKNTFDVADKKGNYINKTDENQVTKQPRFYLIFGNFYGLNDIIKKKEGLFDIKFPSNLTNVITISFKKPDKEKKPIE